MMADDDQQTQALEEKIEGMVEKAVSKHLQSLLEQAISDARSGDRTTGGGKQSSYWVDSPPLGDDEPLS